MPVEDTFFDSIEFASQLIPYTDLQARSGYGRPLAIPDDVIPSLAILEAQGPTEPKLVRCDKDGNLITSLANVSPDVNIHDAHGAPFSASNPLPVTGAGGSGGFSPRIIKTLQTFTGNVGTNQPKHDLDFPTDVKYIYGAQVLCQWRINSSSDTLYIAGEFRLGLRFPTTSEYFCLAQVTCFERPSGTSGWESGGGTVTVLFPYPLDVVAAFPDGGRPHTEVSGSTGSTELYYSSTIWYEPA